MTSTATNTNGVSKLPPIISRMVRAKDLQQDHECWSNPRTDSGLEDKDISELAADIDRCRKDGGGIAGSGVMEALKVIMVKTASGGFINLVADGQRRSLACHELDQNMLVPVIDLVPEPVELTWEMSDKILLDMLRVVKYREGLSDYELSEVAERLRNRGKTLDQIAHAVNMSESWVSRILTARVSATPELLKRWRKGQITTEVFKSLAAVKDPAKQTEQAAKVVKLAKSGNKGEARAVAKEAEIKAKESAKPAPAVKPKVEPVVKGPQVDMFGGDKKPDAAAAPAPKKERRPGPTRAELEDLVKLEEVRPPTGDLVRGIMLGLKFAVGAIDRTEFGKAWNVYVNRVHGIVTKPATKPAKVKKPAKARKPAAKAKKPAKKSKR